MGCNVQHIQVPPRFRVGSGRVVCELGLLPSDLGRCSAAYFVEKKEKERKKAIILPEMMDANVKLRNRLKLEGMDVGRL